VLGYWKSEHHAPYRKAVAREILDVTATSAPRERVLSDAGELYRKKRANLGNESLLFTCLMRMNPQLDIN